MYKRFLAKLAELYRNEMEGASDFAEYKETLGKIKAIRLLISLNETIYSYKIGRVKNDRSEHKGNRTEEEGRRPNFFSGTDLREAGYTADLDGTPGGAPY